MRAMRLPLLACCFAVSAFAAPNVCKDLVDVQTSLKADKPGPLPATVLGDAKCESAGKDLVRCKAAGDAAKLRQRWLDLERDLAGCIGSSPAQDDTQRNFDAKGALTQASATHLWQDWEVESSFGSTGLVLRVHRVTNIGMRLASKPAPAAPVAAPSPIPADACKTVMKLLDPKAPPALPGTGPCTWSNKPPAQLDCKTHLAEAKQTAAAHDALVKMLDGCLKGWSKVTRDEVEGRTTPAARTASTTWENGQWSLAASYGDARNEATVRLVHVGK
jgi:hypothetical protein